VPRVRVVDPADLPWFGKDNTPFQTTVVKGDTRFHHPGSDDELQLFEVRFPPETEITPHAHDEDEIIYVLDGELHLGARTLLPGMSVYIPGRTLYGFRAGSEGVRFLNFRPREDLTRLTIDDLRARSPEA
jgi:quercetin dioxygenase-like cupin family protein